MSTQGEGSMMPWDGGALPAGVSVGENTCIIGKAAFRRFRGQTPNALVIGDHATMDGVQFSVGPAGRINIGGFCCFTGAVLMCELSISIGGYVLIGWNTVIADSDFHPIAPAERILDAVACSSAATAPRPNVLTMAVVIEDDVWIGPNATIFKGVHIGKGAWIGPGSVVTRNVAAGARVAGNPARAMEAS